MSVEPKIWQVACGDEKREYWGWFLDYDMMCIGPGYLGEWNKENIHKYQEEIETTNRDYVKQFAEQVKPGNIVLLKIHSGVVTAGVVCEGYFWSEAFDSVNDWDLQHCWRVRWNKEAITLNDKFRKGYETHHCYRFLDQQNAIISLAPLKGYISRFSSVDTALEARKLARDLTKQLGCIESKLVDLPSPVSVKEKTEVISNLRNAGFSENESERIASAVEELHNLFQFYLKVSYRQPKRNPSEDETRSHLVIPLLKSIGWSPTHIVVEKKVVVGKERVDILLLDNEFDVESCVAAIELKRLHSALGGVKHQVEGYAEKLPNCKVLVVTNGVRYMISRPDGKGNWVETEPDPDKCANLSKKTYLGKLIDLRPENIAKIPKRV